MNRDKFKNYLLENGCEVFTSTNEYEWCRFKVNGKTAIVYQGKFVGSGFVGDAEKVFRSFCYKKSFPFPDHKNTALLRQRGINLMTLVKRDGNECFYCGQELTVEEMTIEHLIPKTAGGLNHLSNFAISCNPCNLEAGHLSVIQKIKLREAKIYRGSF